MTRRDADHGPPHRRGARFTPDLVNGFAHRLAICGLGEPHQPLLEDLGLKVEAEGEAAKSENGSKSKAEAGKKSKK